MISIAQRAYVVLWKELDKWIIPKQLLSPSHFPKDWSFARVSEIVGQVTDRVKVIPDKEYKMVGVKWYGKGIFHRETVKGDSLSSTYVTPLVSDAFIYNRLFAWKGSFAIVPDEYTDCFVSTEFPQFIVNEDRILPRYLYLFFMCKNTIKAVNEASIGSAAVSRNRFKEEDFLDFEIPLPPLTIQQTIVGQWQNFQDEIRAAKNRIENIKQTLETKFLQKLGIVLPLVTLRKGAFALEWKEFERWDTFFYREDFVNLEKQLKSMRHAPLGEILNFTSRTWKTSDFPEGTFQYIEISNVTKDEGIIGSKSIDVNKAPSRATTLLKEGDIILATTRPYLGAFTVVSEKYANCVCSSGFALADKIKIPDIKKDFLLFYLKSPAGLRQMERRMTGGLYPAIVQEELEKILIPLPPLNVQQEIIQQVDEGRVKIAHEGEYSDRKSREIEVEMEALILGTKTINT